MSFSLLLQAATDTIVQAAAQPAAEPPKELSLWYLLKEGGILMIPLALCSMLAIYIFVERFIAIRRYAKTPADFMMRINEKVKEGNIQGAQSLCKNYDGSVPAVILKGVNRIGKPIDHIEKSMENAGRLEVYKMEKNLGILTTIAGIAPMFGFLGTIAGMIILFFNIQQANQIQIGLLAGGIYTKMVTSAVGLIIGLLAYVGANYLNAQIDKNVNKMESATNDFLDMLHQPAHV